MPRKTKRKPLHKTVVHPNRWLAWAIAYSVIVAIALVGYVNVTDLSPNNQVTADTVFQPAHSYTDSRLGFSARYPADWSIEGSGKSSVDFLPADVTKEGVTIGNYTPATEKQIRAALKIISEQRVMVDGVPGTEITSDSENSTQETTVLVTYNKRLYYLSGPLSAINLFVQTFQFINPAN